MRKISIKDLFFLCIICVALSFVAGCEKPIELKSTWRDFDVTVDGVDSEWGRATIYAAKAKVSLTLINDNQDLYIRLYSRDRQVHANVLGMGLTVWFDPDGGKDKTFGVRFPLGMQAEERGPMMPRGGEGDQGERLQKILEESTDELEIVGPGEEKTYWMSLAEAATHGINAKMGFSKGNLIYELRVPLVQDREHLYAIGVDTTDARAGSVIGIGFETPELDMEEMRKEMGQEGQGMPGQGQPPGGDRMPGGMHGGPQGGRSKPERLNLWTKVTLASEPSVHE